jgi:hypothetical protein
MGDSSTSFLGAFVRPPVRLRTMSDRFSGRVRALWIILFLFALGADFAATAYVLREKLYVQPFFASWGLDYDVEYYRPVAIGTLPDSSGRQRVETTSRLLSINGQPVPVAATLGTVEERLRSVSGDRATIRLLTPEQRVVTLEISRGKTADGRIKPALGARLVAALIACAALLICSLLLALRRPRDPVAMIFALSFAAMAACVDPPLQMWMYLGLGSVNDLLSAIWFFAITIALATFPDGVFVPRAYRWMIPIGIPLGIFLALPSVDATVQAVVGVGTLFAILIGQVIRYRRLQPGIERQQIKWAGFGFAVGLILLLTAFILVPFIPAEPARPNPALNLTILLCFSLGVAAMPLGLLIALLRFRLWEADTFIARSAAYAVVSAIVGIVWAISADLAKFVISSTMGQQHQASATAVGAIIAAGVFGPAQSVIMGWTKKRFGGPGQLLAELPEKLREWSLVETPGEIAARALARIERAIHPAYAAVVLDGSGRKAALATIGSTDQSDDTRALPLNDEGIKVGTLFIGRRSDGNAYTRAALAGLGDILEPLARALRATAGRHGREEQMQQMINQMAARLAQLEGGSPKPA